MRSGITPERLEEARRRDAELAARRAGLSRFGRSGRLRRQISTVAVLNAVRTEGREVLSREGEGYWRDQDRRYFGIDEQRATLRSPRNRWGKVKERIVYPPDPLGERDQGKN